MKTNSDRSIGCRQSAESGLRKAVYATFAGVLVWTLAGVCTADIVELSGGGKLVGTVQRREDGVLYVETAKGQVVGVAEERVVRITPTESVEATYESMVESLPSDDAQAWYEAALWCKKNYMSERATELAERAIRINPDHQGARGLLGYVQHEGRWMTLAEKMKARGFVRHGGRWVRAQAARKLEQGLVLLDGRWVTPEEANRRKGLVQYLGKWMTRSAAGKLHARRLREWDRAKLLPAVEQSGGVSTRPMPVAETDHYVVRAVGSNEMAQAVAKFMEALYDKLGKTFRFHRKPSGRFKVYVFNTRQQFGRFAAAMNITLNKNAIGFFDPLSRVIAAYFTGTPGQDVIRVLAHEGTHQFIHMVEGVPPPLWLDEGLAEYFGAVEWDGNEIRTGLVNHLRLAELFAMVATGNHIPLGILFHSRERLLFGPPQYAEAWGLVYFFFNYRDGAYIPLFSQFFAAVKSGENQDAAFRRITGMPLAHFERLWLNYVMSLAVAELRPAGASATASTTSP